MFPRRVEAVFRDYFGKDIKKKSSKHLTLTSKLFIMGEIETIIYKTDRLGKQMRFIHDFKRRSAILTDGKNLLIPDVKVTERGIED